MDAVLLACTSACLFGAMTVALRIALRGGVVPEVGTVYTVLTAFTVILVHAGARGEWDLASAWPFLLAGALAPGISQILFTFAIRDAGASRTSVAVGSAPLVALLIAFVVDNTRRVKVGFVFGDHQTRLIYVLLITFVLGILVDRLWQHWRKRRARRE